MITHTRRGGRRIELFVPFEWNGITVRHIDIGPCRLDHLLRWQQGEFTTALALLADMADTSEEFLRQLCYPDTDRVISAYIDMVPPPIQSDIGNNLVPTLVKAEEPGPAESVEPIKPEPGWPYQGPPPVELPEVPGDDDEEQGEQEPVDLDLVSER